MSGIRWTLPAWTLICSCALPAAARAADVFDAIPDTALAVVLVNRLEESSDKLDRLARLVRAPSASLLTLAKVQSGIHAGFDEKGTGALAVMPAKDPSQPPQAVLFVPLTDYAKFVEQLQPTDAKQQIAEIQLAGHPMLVCQQGDYAALTNPNAKGLLEDVRSSIKPLSSAMSPLRTWLTEVDAAAVATPAGIKFAVEKGQQQMQQLKALLALAGQQQPAQQQQQLVQSLAAMEQGLKLLESEVSHAALAARVDENGAFHGLSRVRFVPGGEWAAAARGLKAPKPGLLSGLPRGPFWAAFGTAFPKSWREGLAKMSENMVAMNPAFAQLPADQRAKLTKAMNDMLMPVESMSMWIGPPVEGEGLFGNATAIVRVDNARQYLDTYEAAIKAMPPAPPNAQVPAVTYEIKRIQVDGQEVLDVITDLSALKQPAMAQFKPIFDKIYGPQDKLHAYLAVADEHTLVMTYLNVDKLQAALKAAKEQSDGPAAEPSVAETAALLPGGAQWTAFIQPQASWFQMLAGPGTKLPELPAAPPLGLAGKISPAGFQGELAAPAATLEAVGTLVAKLRGQ